jgi:hypothetical protein
MTTAVTDSVAMFNYLRQYDEALDMCPDAKLAIFALPGAFTYASRDKQAVAERAAKWSVRGLNAYIHTHLHALPEGEGPHRGSIATARVAIGLFGDIDAQGPGRKKPASTLCTTVSDAIGIVEKFDRLFKPLSTSVLIASGHGCYPMIRFNEPLVITSPADRALVESIGRRYHAVLHRIGSEKGWPGATDYCDLAKVLRLPGTVNYKDPANPQAVTFLYNRDVRFTLSDLEELLPVEPGEKPKSIAADSNIPDWVLQEELILDENRTPPREKFDLIAEMLPAFLRTWNHDRPDLTDQSQSGYDLSLATQAAQAGWTDQEIADLIIANRRKNGADLKLKPDYYSRTIRRARHSVETWNRRQVEEGAAESQGTEHTGDADTPPDDCPTSLDRANPGDAGEAPSRSALLQVLSSQLGVQVFQVIKYASDPESSYQISTELGDITLDSIEDLITQPRLRNRVADVTGRLLPSYTAKKWHPVAQNLLRACEKDDLGPDATERGVTSGWLRGYLSERPIHRSLQEADAGREPFRLDGATCIFLDNLRAWLQISQGARITQRKLATQLRRLGAENIPSFDVTLENRKTTRGFWKLLEGPWTTTGDL